jgi:hypothetical protein
MVVRFDLTDGRWRRLWIVAQQPEAELCARDPGFDDDVVVRTSAASLTDWHTGKISLGGAMRAGLMQVEGRRHAVREVASWGGRSAFAHVKPAPRRAADRTAAWTSRKLGALSTSPP